MSPLAQPAQIEPPLTNGSCLSLNWTALGGPLWRAANAVVRRAVSVLQTEARAMEYNGCAAAVLHAISAVEAARKNV